MLPNAGFLRECGLIAVRSIAILKTLVGTCFRWRTRSILGISLRATETVQPGGEQQTSLITTR